MEINLESLDILGKKIDELLNVVKSLRNDNAGLNEKLREKEEEARGLMSEVGNLQAEKDLVKERLAYYIKNLEDF